MKIKNHLWIASLASMLALVGCETTHHPQSPPPADTAAAPVQTEMSAFLIDIVKTAPQMVSIGDQFTYVLKITARHDVGNLMVSDMVPAGASLVGSAPEANNDGGKMSWNLGNLNKGDSKTIQVTLKAEKEGQLVSCATATAMPRVCTTTIVGKAQLAITKTGPATAMLGQQVAYNVVVQNTGNTPARNVVVTDTVPDGLVSAGGEKELTFKVGDLAAGASKPIAVTLTAQKRGKVCNKVAADSSNAGKANAEVCTTIVSAGVKIAKTTKDKDIFMNRAAAYDIVVSNTGDTDLTGVVVTDTAAPETVIATAEDASVTGKTATWNVGTLKAGEKKSFAIKIVSKVPGQYCDTATVTTGQGLSDSAKDCTVWRGVTGVLVELADDPDPIQVGETSKYTVKVTNQGSTIDITQLAIVITLPPELDVVASTVSDGGRVDGKTITFPVVPTVGPKAAVVRTYIAKGVKAGDARTKIAVTTSMRKEPIEQFESTTVY
jgi:uncharacterized repeat protein (TIGR01451 family)